jgi:hypothetical protein
VRRHQWHATRVDEGELEHHSFSSVVWGTCAWNAYGPAKLVHTRYIGLLHSNEQFAPHMPLANQHGPLVSLHTHVTLIDFSSTFAYLVEAVSRCAFLPRPRGC